MSWRSIAGCVEKLTAKNPLLPLVVEEWSGSFGGFLVRLAETTAVIGSATVPQN
jgi:hypothetical protein